MSKLAEDACHNSTCLNCAPEIVLQLIFDALKGDSGALRNCCLVSPNWNGMLEKYKTDFMMPLVLPILIRTLNPFPDEELKKCRLVSRTWKRGVDELNGRQPEFFESEFPTYSYGLAHWCIWRSFPFGGWTQFRIGVFPREWGMSYATPPEIMHDLQQRTVNPFLSRAVHFETCSAQIILLNVNLSYKYAQRFDCPRGVPLSLYRQSLKMDKCFHSMLSSVGTHIWHLIWTTGPYSDHKDYARNVIKTLRLVPNIISLALTFTSCSENTDWIGAVPSLPNLVALSIRSMSGKAYISQFLLASYGKQLETLDCYSLDVDLAPIEFPKMRNLKIRESEDYLHKLSSILIAPCLEKIFVRMGMCKSGSNNPNWDLIVGLENFSSSLQLIHAEGILYGCSKDQSVEGRFCEKLEAQRGSRPVPQFSRVKSLLIDLLFARCSSDLDWLLSKFDVLEKLTFVTTESKRFYKDMGEVDVGRVARNVPSLRKIYFGRAKKWERQ